MPAPSKPVLDDRTIVGAIEDLIAGRPAPQDLGSDSVSVALTRLSNVFQERASRDLDRIVAANIQIGETSIAVAKILDGARSIDTRTHGMAAAITEMVASVGEVANSTESVAMSMDQVNEQVRTSQRNTETARHAMAEVVSSVQNASSTATSLAKASEAINSIVGTISEVASQTNLLALNATIEAARAGEAGKGFAVVAGEVKSLSKQTGSATEHIRNRIEELRGEIAGIVKALDATTLAAEHGRQTMEALNAEMTYVGNQAQIVNVKMSEVSGILVAQRAASNEIAEGVSAIAALTATSAALVSDLSKSIDSSQALTLESQNALSQLDFPGKVVRLAKSDHVLWKKKLADMAVGRVALKPDELADHRSCRLGVWYYGDGGRSCAHLSAFKELERPHEAVHRHGIAAARLFNQGRHSEALAEIEQVQSASAEVLAQLNEIGKNT